MIYYRDDKYNFVEFFNERNGFYLRSNIFKNGIETDEEPLIRSFPELLDIGIMGTCLASKSGMCKQFGIDCYQNAPINQRPNMTLDTYTDIIKQCKNKVFQVALGGAGDPNKHENFEEILKITRKNNIIPNITTSGYEITDREINLIKKYCGAVAVSFYTTLDKDNCESNSITINTINNLISRGCVTNIHYVISKRNINEVLYRLENDLFPQKINSIVFLLYKAVGSASKEYMLSANDSEYIKFIKMATSKKYRYKIGFDSCQTPALKLHASNVAYQSLEWCEAARFSMYIDCQNIAFPCSFGWNNKNYSYDLTNDEIINAWNSQQFNAFREMQKNKCIMCDESNCYNCALNIGVNVCGKFIENTVYI